MTQHFPQYPDVPLKHAPLGEVICQVRYSPIFRIATEAPSELQDSILDWFPEVYFAEDDDRHLYQFLSPDRSWAFWLGVDAFTLSTRNYSVWDKFGSYLAIVQSAMQNAYRIASYRRIGLRYLNVFTPDNTRAKSLSEIAEVLRPELVMPLKTNPLAETSDLFTHLLLSEADGTLAMRVSARTNPAEGGPVLILDLDFSTEGTLVSDGLVERCKRYHDVIYGAFRWSVNPDMLDLFGPDAEGVRG